MNRQGDANLYPDQQGSTEQKDVARLDRPHARMSPNHDVTATVTNATDLLAASRRGYQAAHAAGSAPLLADSISGESEADKAFITDCARNIEGLRSDQEIKDDWGLDEQGWASLAENISLLNAIKAERQRRIRSGEAARESAQRHFARAPSILARILEDEGVSPRARIEAARELRQAAGDARENPGTGEKFIIMIDLGEDHRVVKEFNQPARIPCDDGDAQ
jgi:hypothetical protein